MNTVQIIEELTDVVAILVIAALGIYGDPSLELVGTIATIAIGRRYVKSKTTPAKINTTEGDKDGR